VAPRPRQRAVSNIPDKQQSAWNELVHDIANDLAALKLLLAAIGLADDDEERSRHLGVAKQTIVEGESRLQALREAVRRELGESPTAPKNGASKPRPRKQTKAGR
jgi:hypothetical protein